MESNKTNERRTYRLGDVESVFDGALKKARSETPNLKEAAFLRWCIRKALSDTTQSFTQQQAKEAIDYLHEIKRELARVGGNLNQVAHYFNIHSHLHESELKANHLEIQKSLKLTTKTIEGLLNELRRSVY